MATLLNIPQQFFDDATNAVTFERRKFDTGVNSNDIKKVITSYVNAGLNKKIVDWSNSLTRSQKNDVVSKVIMNIPYYDAETPAVFVFDPVKVESDLGFLTTLEPAGLVNKQIAFPRAAQEEYERQLADLHANDESVITQGVTMFFGWVKSLTESLLKGFGLNIPGEVIALVAIAFLIYKFVA